MKTDMFDVLLYLFENYMSETPYLLPEEAGELLEALEDAGFHDIDINKAFLWLKGLSPIETRSLESTVTLNQKAFRIFNPEEQIRLSRWSLGFLLVLEQLKLIDPYVRELILDRLIALEHFEIDTEKVKWIILIIVYHQYQDKKRLMLIEELLFINRRNQPLH